MRMSIRLLAATAMGVATFVSPAHAQDMTTATFNGTTIWVGGGVQFLSLPDIRFVLEGDHLQKNSEFSEYGGSFGAGIETALGYWNGMRVTAGVKGFFSALENSDRKNCQSSADCQVFALDGNIAVGSTSFTTKTDREADYWGGAVELKFGGGQPVHAKPNLYRNDYFIVGADIRGIDQNSKLRGRGGDLFTYREELDTTYYGGYVGLGGEYSFGFLGVGGLYDRLGLRTFLSARAGLYSAQTDYDGRLALSGVSDTRLSKSTDDLAFIGSVSLETRKQIGPRTSLSLWTDYEYISSVPKMRYASELGQTPRIVDDDAFAARTMLRLNIGLGSSELYTEPLK